MTRDEAWKLAEHWIAAWNAHDLDLILAHGPSFRVPDLPPDCSQCASIPRNSQIRAAECHIRFRLMAKIKYGEYAVTGLQVPS